MQNYKKYWGKADKTSSDYHLLVYHALDVAAVGQILLTKHPTLLKQLSNLTGLSRQQFQQWMVFFLALHDIGKFNDSFQNLRPDLLKKLQKRESNRNYSERHDSLGYLLWFEVLKSHFIDLGITPKGKSKRRSAKEHQLIKIWMAAVTGHHGMPPKNINATTYEYYEKADEEVLKSYVSEIYDLFLKQDTFPCLEQAQLELSSWWLAGFAVLCDWLGSNRDYFPYSQQIQPLANYWTTTLKQAEKAILATGLLASKVSTHLSLSDLIQTTHKVNPTPLQKKAQEIPLTDSPQLFILEDVTGAGKTEAAVILAHRLMQQSTIQGVYFALPTMATANAMYQRLAKAYQAFYCKGEQPSLVLAHGASMLSTPFRQSILPFYQPNKSQQGDGTETAESYCNDWLADNRKKALLADIGIGTIDQALLAILPAKHQSLRLLGLLNKVLIIDEVHAYDAYMQHLLCHLLTAYALAGGSVILLSATLAKKQRQQLIDAYSKGRKVKPPEIKKTALSDYPLLTCLQPKQLIEKVIKTRKSVQRTVKIQFIHQKEAIDAFFEEKIKNKECVCWIRNTVIDACDAYDWLTKAHPDWSVQLFHARFAMGDRLAIEKDVLNQFGKDSTSTQRQGKILIATQVVEQSLDADWDQMLTDLAPIDLIIQRAGRLCRHSRDKAGNRINGKDQRGQVVLHIYSPTLTTTPQHHWYADFFKKAQHIYTNHGQLWLTADLLKQKGQFKMPDDARFLIEGVYSDEAEAKIPETLLESVWTTEGNSKADASQANMNALKLATGYSSETSQAQWQDEGKTPTRLGEDTTTVYLARWLNQKIIPWYLAEEEAYSRVLIRRYWINQEKFPEMISNKQIEACKASLPNKGKNSVLVILVKNTDNQWQGEALNENDERVIIEYSEVKGLLVC